MKGIILKDLYDNFYIKKNLASYVFGLGFIIAAGMLVRTQYSFILYVELISTVFGSAALEAASEQDEKSSFNRLMLAFPLTKTQIVLSRYLLALFFQMAAWLLALAYALCNALTWHTVTLAQALSFWLLSICISVAFTAIVYVIYFLFGKKIGMIIYVFIAVLLAGSYGASAVLMGLEHFVAMDKTLLLCIGFPCAFLLYGLSFFLSVRIYKWKTA